MSAYCYKNQQAEWSGVEWRVEDQLGRNLEEHHKEYSKQMIWRFQQ